MLFVRSLKRKRSSILSDIADAIELTELSDVELLLSARSNCITLADVNSSNEAPGIVIANSSTRADSAMMQATGQPPVMPPVSC